MPLFSKTFLQKKKKNWLLDKVTYSKSQISCDESW